MLNSIYLLPTKVINQIAAGEVIERPANLVKELIENSLDAKASKIEIHFSEGGRSIQIKDNGDGIKESELHLALAPHSTSKIKFMQDIWDIHSYGFRGEALASIAAVSDLTLVSKPKNQNQAARIKNEFGKQTPTESVGSEQGTNIIVKNLFQNIPARLKFLKSEASEITAIKNTIKAMALSHSQVEFKVLYKKKLLFYWPSTIDFQKRVETILSINQTFITQLKYQDINIEAVLCAPNKTLSNRKQMWFFVQNRWVEDTTIYAAVMSAYRGLLMHGEYPIVVLKLICPKDNLDVNVHPTKSRVRFKNTSPIFKAVHHSIRSLLEQAPWIQSPNLETQIKKTETETEQKFSFVDKSFDTMNIKKRSQSSFESKISLQNIKDLKVNIPSSSPNDSESQSQKPPISTYWSSLDILSQAHLTYIIAQNREAIIFIDQHAAHERILYEKLMLSWNTAPSGKNDGKIQKRLIPLVLNLEEPLIKAILSVQDELIKIGIQIELSGPQELMIHSAPVILKDMALKEALTQLAEGTVSQGGSFAIEKKISDLCASMACHCAIRAGQALSKAEITELLVQMDNFALSSFCPHGRPVFVKYALSQLEKDFCRRV